MKFSNYINKMMMLSVIAMAMSMTSYRVVTKMSTKWSPLLNPMIPKNMSLKWKQACQCLIITSWMFLPPPIATRMSSMP